MAAPNVAAAARAAGISRRHAYRVKDKDPTFSDAWDDCLGEAVDDLEEEVFKRAKSNSDVLAIFLLKAHKPERYRENYTPPPPPGDEAGGGLDDLVSRLDILDKRALLERLRDEVGDEPG